MIITQYMLFVILCYLWVMGSWMMVIFSLYSLVIFPYFLKRKHNYVWSNTHLWGTSHVLGTMLFAWRRLRTDKVVVGNPGSDDQMVSLLLLSPSCLSRCMICRLNTSHEISNRALMGSASSFRVPKHSSPSHALFIFWNYSLNEEY